MEKVLKSYLEYICGANNVDENVPLSTKTTFRIGGPARFFVTVPTKESLVRLISTLNYIDQKYFIIGSGANILASDHGYDGIIIKLGFTQIIDNQCFVYADAGASLKRVCNFAREHSLSGLEWACGIPATVGGAVFMNAGAYGGQISDIAAMVDVLVDGEIKSFDNKHLRFAHRKSIFQSKPNWIILGTYFQLNKSDKKQIEAREAEFLARRREAQPAEPSAGSIFKRPNMSIIPAKAIDELGLKGTKIGGAQISLKHAGFIVNTGNAKSKDVRKLISLIRRKIYDKYKIKLETEIKVLK